MSFFFFFVFVYIYIYIYLFIFLLSASRIFFTHTPLNAMGLNFSFLDPRRVLHPAPEDARAGCKARPKLL